MRALWNVISEKPHALCTLNQMYFIRRYIIFKTKSHASASIGRYWQVNSSVYCDDAQKNAILVQLKECGILFLSAWGYNPIMFSQIVS